MTIPCEPALRQRLVSVAQEAEAPDLLISGAKVWNAFTGEIRAADVAVCADRIAKVGRWNGSLTAATRVIEAEDRLVVPGYIEPHTHPWPFANPLSLGEQAVRRGTTCLVYDELMLHLAMGRDRLLGATRALSAASLPHVFWVARIASQSRFDGEESYFSREVIAHFLESEHFLGTGEMTRWADLLDPGRSLRLLTILEDARRHGKVNDGHFAGASSRRLAALANTGIHSCHEAINAEEALERLRHGLWVLLRNSSLREDLTALLPALAGSAFHERFAFTTDGAGEGHVHETGVVDHLIHLALDAGVDPTLAYRMATLNPASFLGLDQDLGAVAAGRIADINILSDLRVPMPQLVVCRGKVLAENGALIVPPPSESFPWVDVYSGSEPAIPEWDQQVFVIPNEAPNPFPAARLTNAAITRESPVPLSIVPGGLWPEDGLVLAVTDRQWGWITRGVVQNFGKDVDALASTYTTNAGILVLGRSPRAMANALSRLRAIGGGITVCGKNGSWSDFPLPMAGIHRRGGFEEGAEAARVFQSALADCGYPHSDAKYSLIFMTCDMLPELRATEAGWLRVKTGEILFAAERPIGAACDA